MDEMSDSHEPATKGDLRALAQATKADLNAFAQATKADLSGFATKEDLREIIRPIAITVANHTAELADIRGYLKDKMVTRDEFHSRMDGFAARVYDQDYSTAKNRTRLDEHEQRISALEAKRA